MDPGWKKAYVSQGPIQTATVDHDSVVAGDDSHADNEAAIRTVEKSGFDLKKLSIVGKDYSTQEAIVWFYNAAPPPRIGSTGAHSETTPMRLATFAGNGFAGFPSVSAY